ncbi:MAG: SDR family NAD(P)-dependent oxidoreductase [Actinomycetia bacterium]|nr:SDR family NAD(P)-dependent oxidoreductase [Actinomycetes bacterium]
MAKAARGTGRLEGKRALVTGGGSGIGAAVTARFREEGAAVLTADLKGGELACDVRERADVERAVEETASQLGGLDTLILNAGRIVVGLLHELPEEDWDDGFAVNLKSSYLFVQAAWKHLVEAQGASITSTASIVGLWGSENQAAYCATKAGVIMLTKCLALDGARDGIRANCVCPGFTQTPLLEGFMAAQADPEATKQAAVALHPAGRLGSAVDMAEAYVYLSSDEASFVSGIAVPVDGGLTVGIWGG